MSLRTYKKEGFVRLFLTLFGRAEHQIRLKFPVGGTLAQIS